MLITSLPWEQRTEWVQRRFMAALSLARNSEAPMQVDMSGRISGEQLAPQKEWQLVRQ